MFGKTADIGLYTSMMKTAVQYFAVKTGMSQSGFCQCNYRMFKIVYKSKGRLVFLICLLGACRYSCVQADISFYLHSVNVRFFLKFDTCYGLPTKRFSLLKNHSCCFLSSAVTFQPGVVAGMEATC